MKWHKKMQLSFVVVNICDIYHAIFVERVQEIINLAPRCHKYFTQVNQ